MQAIRTEARRPVSRLRALPKSEPGELLIMGADEITLRPLLSQSEIAQAVGQLGARISADYEHQELTLLGVLNGCLMFVADLMRNLSTPHQLAMLPASSYRGTATDPGELSVAWDYLPDLRQRHVLIVDDIFDTGRTMQTLLQRIQEQQPASVRTAVLLRKPTRSEVSLTPDYCCFEIPDAFVVGYGLDYAGHYRHLPYIATLELHNTLDE